MGKVKKTNVEEPQTHLRPPTTPEEEEAQCIAMAYRQARKQMENGTASSQIIVHFLRLGTEKARLESEKLAHETQLLKAKTSAIEANAEDGRKYEEAVAAMKRYSGHGTDEDPDVF